VWQRIRAELHPRGVEIVTVALDLDPEAARPWIEQSGAEHPQLVDTAHALDELLGFVNVPMAVWVDEDQMIVRPAEVATVARSEFRDVELPEGLPDQVYEMMDEVRRIPEPDPDRYVAALTDWAERGADSEHAMSPEEVVAASAPRPFDEAEAAARFELGQHLHHAGFADDARRHFREAHRLQPDNWTYKRNAWELVSPGVQGPTEHYEGDWLTDIRSLTPERYYPRTSWHGDTT